MSIDVVYATSTQVVNLPNGTVRGVRKGSHWSADDPVVKAGPDGLFSRDPRWGLEYTPGSEPDGYDAPIETASAVPGERRTTRRAS